MKARPKILLVDDEAELRALFKRALTADGFEVIECGDGAEAIDVVPAEEPALIVLDVDMPRLNGWKTLAELRRRGCEQPVLMITHVNDVDSRVRGLETGADDYLGKPCAPEELLARVRALLRRTLPAREESRILRLGELTIDLERKTASRAGRPVRFTRTEYVLLDILLSHGGQPVAREHLLKTLWGESSAHTRTHTIDTHLWRLRKKLGEGSDSAWIENLPGIGYRMKLEPPPKAAANTSPLAG